jgi:hypothetical protein
MAMREDTWAIRDLVISRNSHLERSIMICRMIFFERSFMVSLRLAFWRSDAKCVFMHPPMRCTGIRPWPTSVVPPQWAVRTILVGSVVSGPDSWTTRWRPPGPFVSRI